MKIRQGITGVFVAAIAAISAGQSYGATNWPAFGAGPTAAFSGGTFLGLDAQQAWMASPVFANESVQCVVASGGRAFVVAKAADSVPNDRLVAFDAATGDVLWRSPVLTRPNGGTAAGRCPAVDGSSVFVGLSGGVKAFETAGGTELWSRTDLPVDLSGTYDPTSPVVADGVVYVAPRGNDRHMALDASTGATVWGPAPIGYRTLQPPRVAGGYLLAPTYQGESQAAARATDGAFAWVTGDNNNYFPVATVDGSLAYVARQVNGGDHRVEARSLSTGAIQWSYTLPSDLSISSLALSGGSLFVAAPCLNYCGLSGSKLIALDAATGAPAWTQAADVSSYGTWPSYGSYRASLVVLGDVVKAGSGFYRTSTGESLGTARGWPAADASVENYPAYGDGEVFALVPASGGLRLARFIPGAPPPESGGGSQPGGGVGGGGTSSCPTPPAGPVGVSINGGDQFTNTPRISLDIIWPVCTTSLAIANDGGFRSARTVAASTEVPWDLVSSGPERLPKTVYVRFGSATTNYTDDIILDETPPLLQSASASFGSAMNEMAAGRQVRLRLRAADKTSGVARMQVGPTKGRAAKTVPFRRSSSVRAVSSRLVVRVQDRAGNWSRWRTVRIAG
jgi:outer membrane protein assembly factor BamB